MSRILVLMLLVLLVEQELYFVALASVSTSSYMTAWVTPQYSTWGQLRGGQDLENEEIKEVGDEEDSNESESEDAAATNSKAINAESILQPKAGPTKQKLTFQSAFRLLQEVREEAVSLAHTVADDDGNTAVHEMSVDEGLAEPSGKPPTIVGDRRAKQNTRKLKVSDDAVLTAPSSIVVDANRVAPLSSRLLEAVDNVSEKDNEDASGAAVGASSNDVAKLWWPNIWTQQLSELQNDNANETSGVHNGEEESEPEASEMDLEESTDGSDEDISMNNGGDDFDEIITDSQGEDDDDEMKVEIISIPPEAEEESITNEDLPQGSDHSRSFLSSGAWIPIDNIFTLGLASKLPALRVSRKLRQVRKLSARVTGLHGFMSGKPSPAMSSSRTTKISQEDEERMKSIQLRMAAFEKKREGVIDAAQVQEQQRRIRFGFLRRGREERQEELIREAVLASEQQRLDDEADERRRKEEEARQEARRMERVKEIDRLIAEGQARLQDLVCEKDVLQRRLNPLFDYTSETVEVLGDDLPDIEMQEWNNSNTAIRIEASRKFKFPPDDLVEEYLDMTFSSRRIAKLNHADLWQDPAFDEEDDESIGDDLLTPSADAFKLYQDDSFVNERKSKGQSGIGRKRGGGSWLLRQTLGKGPSIGEKIGEVAETAAYKAVCAAVMAFLARLLSALHGVNVMKHSDIRLVLEQAPDLPRVGEGIIPGSSSDYAEEAIRTVMRRKSKKSRRRSKYHAMEDSFVQRDAVTEMLLSHVQISAPLLKLFPLAWQRAFLGNIITLATAIMSDFFEGLQFQILGHSLTFAFAPITQDDMINHIGLSGSGFNSRRAKADEFEEAVRATAGDVGENLKFLDRWHERALGSGVLRTQIANLIARIVLTLTDEILAGARMDLWSAQAGGPRMLAGLEYRTTTEE